MADSSLISVININSAEAVQQRYLTGNRLTHYFFAIYSIAAISLSLLSLK